VAPAKAGTAAVCLVRALPRDSRSQPGAYPPFGEWNGPFLAPYLALLPTDFQTEVRARVTLEEAAEAIEGYKREMTGGKVLIMPGGM
jgi:hypothetical protein